MMMSAFGSSARFIIGPVSILEIVPRNQGGYKTMQSLEPVINYLVDPNSGLKQVMTEFLNAVMLFEAYLQSGALPYERTSQRKAHRNGTRPRTIKTRVGEITLDKP
jgi:transposase-like protein